LQAHVLSGLWTWGADIELLRDVLSEVWRHNHLEILSMFPKRGSSHQPTLRRLFQAARFPFDHLPERVSIYRGIAVPNGDTPSCTGISWSLRRDLACWFAMHLPYPGGAGMIKLPSSWTP